MSKFLFRKKKEYIDRTTTTDAKLLIYFSFEARINS